MYRQDDGLVPLKPSETLLTGSPSHADISRHAVATALTVGHRPRLTVAIRNYVRRSRAHGDTVQQVVKDLMGLVHDESPGDGALAKRSSEVAQCAIDVYYEEPELLRAAARDTDAIRFDGDPDSSTWSRP